MNGARSLRIAVAFTLLAGWMSGCSHMQPRPAGAADVPFRLALEPFRIAGLPGLHSVAHTVYRNKLVIVAGRTNGMHAFLPQRQAGTIWSFPPAKANDRVYVVDLASRRLDGSASVNDLPSAIARQLRSTNAQSFSRDGWFYIVGGYGVTEDGKSMLTFDQVVAIDLKALIDTVRSGGKLDDAFARQHMHLGDHPALAVTGGGIAQLGARTLLVFGQLFNGLYTTDGSVAQQEYSQAVRVLELSLANETENGIRVVKVNYVGKCPDPPPTQPQPTPDGPYHRRDFTLAHALAPGGASRIAVYGGVFKGGRMEGYVNPVYLTPATSANCAAGAFNLGQDDTSSQWLGQYDGAVVPLYSESRNAMYTTFFGGISQYYWDPSSRMLKRDAIDFSKDPPVDGLPFINSISTLRVGGVGNGDFLHVDEQFPPRQREPMCSFPGGSPVRAPYLGANSWFVMANGAPVRSEVFLLDRIRTPTEIGYIFGGIASTLPYPGDATCASDVIYAVKLDPRSATNTIELEAPRP